MIRATSLSGVANHYVSISPGPNSNPSLDEGATLGLGSNDDPGRPRPALQHLPAAGPPRPRPTSSAAAPRSTPAAAPTATDLKYFAPVAEPDQRLRRRAATPTSTSSNASSSARASSRRPSPSAAASSPARSPTPAPPSTRSPARTPRSTQTLRLLPAVFRQSNTTFVNLRAALDDLDPLVETAKPATKDLAPFLAELRPVISKAVPVFRNLRLTVRRPGFANDAARTARRPARRPAARREGVPALRRRDRRLPAEPQLRPRLHAGHLQRLRQARPDHRLLRRQRPLRARSQLRGPQHLQLQRGGELKPITAEPNSTTPSAARRNT